MHQVDRAIVTEVIGALMAARDTPDPAVAVSQIEFSVVTLCRMLGVRVTLGPGVAAEPPPPGGPRSAFDVKGEGMANPEELQYNPATSAFNQVFGVDPTGYTAPGSNSANSGATVQVADGPVLASYQDTNAGYTSAQEAARPSQTVHGGDTQLPGQLNELISGLGPDATADSGAGKGTIATKNPSSEFGPGPMARRP